MNYSKAQMLFDDSLHYSWEETQQADKNILDRTNGHQVLAFINRFAAEQQISGLKELQELEFLIRYGTPSNVKTIGEISAQIRAKLESQAIPAI